MIELKFSGLYRHPRQGEPVYAAIPLKKGILTDINQVTAVQEGRALPTQVKATSCYEDGSARYLFVRFPADLPGGRETKAYIDLFGEYSAPREGMKITSSADLVSVDTGCLEFTVKNHTKYLFETLCLEGKSYEKEQFCGPALKDGEGNTYEPEFESFRLLESGPVCTVILAKGIHKGKKKIEFEMKITAYTGKPWLELSCRIINTTPKRLHVASLVFAVKGNAQGKLDFGLDQSKEEIQPDSTGCGDHFLTNSREGIYHTMGVHDLPEIEGKIPLSGVRTCAAASNYKTSFSIGEKGKPVNKIIDAAYLLGEANEHFSEVLYGTLFADRTDEAGGVCATIYQAQQNYPKAVKADRDAIYLMLVPEGVEKVVMESGMSREQRFMLHFHGPEVSMEELDNRSLIYQMPDRPVLSSAVYKESQTMPDIFTKNLDPDVELAFILRADDHARCYGMLNWGDAPDDGYTQQGRGGKDSVWTNNEYDYPHACALLYARTGIRRFFDYMAAAASHWMDVDVCHYSQDTLKLGGQYEHSAGHIRSQVMVPSHEWVEGLLDYYHFTGDERAFYTALGIGENVLKLLDTPMFSKAGEQNARETGWALRTLTALYVETHDEKWNQKSRWIISHFKEWEQEFGNWLSPYTDNTAIRVPFMISIAVGSLMRYYRVFPSQELKRMILSAIDDLIEHAYEETGLFLYKELPSLERPGSNTLVLEALAIAYELTGREEYLSYGRRTFQNAVKSSGKSSEGKRVEKDTVISGKNGTKSFAQSFIPMAVYYRAVMDRPFTACGSEPSVPKM